jgi:hypothetical protein
MHALAPAAPTAGRTGTVTAVTSVHRMAPVLLITYTTLGLLTTARITRLLTADRISQPLRAAIVRRFGPDSWPGYYIHCRWCVSMYTAPVVAAGVVWLVPAYRAGWWAQTLLTGALLALTYSHGTALLAGLEDDE